MPAPYPLTIANQALLRLGAAPLGAWDEASAAGQIVRASYPTERRAALEFDAWVFCQASITPDLRADRPKAGELPRWSHAWTLPADLLALRAIYPSGSRVPLPVLQYEIADQVLLTRAADIVIAYTRDTPEDRWPALFAAYLIARLAASWAMTMSDDLALKQAMDRDAAVALQDLQGWHQRHRPTSVIAGDGLLAAWG